MSGECGGIRKTTKKRVGKKFNPKKMKRSLINLITFFLVFALVLSCNEQDETLNSKGTTSSGTVSGSQNRNSNSARTAEAMFNGLEGDALNLTTAKKWTANYRGTLESPDEILAHYFGFEIIQQILKQPSCVGIRIYYAIDDTGEKKLILIGVDSNGENLLPVAGGRLSEEGNVVADFSFPCPTYCPQNGL